MRVFRCALVVFLFFPHAAVSQSLNWGVEIGIGHSSLPYSDDIGVREAGRISFNAMLFGEHDLSSLFAVQSGVRYSRYGNDVLYGFRGNTPQTGIFQVSQHHISVPLRVKYSPFQRSIYILAGPQIGYIVLADVYHEVFGERGFTENEDIIDQVDRLNLGVSFGMGYRIAIGNRAVMVQVLYDRGVSSIGKTEFWSSTWSTRALSFQTGILL
ncbi:MAG: outer membrane beta-barrel protein [Pseudomonadota bacterium]